MCQRSSSLPDSNLDPRNVVVWGMTVMMSRSMAAHGPLKIRAGLTFSTMPRSTNQTSPRFGTLLLFVQRLERDAGALRNVVVRQRLAIEFNGSVSLCLVNATR